LQAHRLEDERNRGGSADVIDRNFRSQRHTATAVPDGMPAFSLNELVADARVVIGSGDSQRVKVAAPYVLLNAATVETRIEVVPKRRSVELRARVAAAHHATE
jgi:hypothetical protein